MSRTRSLLIFANDSRCKQSKKNPKHSFVDIGKEGTCAKFQQNIFNSMIVGHRQIFEFFRQNTWFLEINGALSKFLNTVLHYLISITKF